MTRYSVLDLCSVREGGSVREALDASVSLAQHAEALNFSRFWVAEHHNFAGIASAATSLVIGHVAQATRHIRVGAGGVMLPNHAPLVIAEQFGTLEALHPGRIDLGLGRAPGTDQLTMNALRRNLDGDVSQFPKDVLELMRYFDAAKPGQAIVATPGAGAQVPLWILGSSLFGAQLAASLGLPFAFASHFAPGQLHEAVTLYRDRFSPSAQLDKPYLMLGYNVIAADSSAQADLLASSMRRSFVNLRKGQPGKLQPPSAAFNQSLSAADQALLNQIMACSAVGCADEIAEKLKGFIHEFSPDEIIFAGQIYDHPARLRSFDSVADVMAGL